MECNYYHFYYRNWSSGHIMGDKIMSGTIEGGRKARETNYKRHGEDFYREIGRKGGMISTTGGFASNPDLAKTAGAKGGRASSRGKSYEYEWMRKRKKAMKMLKKSASYRDISRAIGIPYGSVLYRIRREAL